MSEGFHDGNHRPQPLYPRYSYQDSRALTPPAQHLQSFQQQYVPTHIQALQSNYVAYQPSYRLPPIPPPQSFASPVGGAHLHPYQPCPQPLAPTWPTTLPPIREQSSRDDRSFAPPPPPNSMSPSRDRPRVEEGDRPEDDAGSRREFGRNESWAPATYDGEPSARPPQPQPEAGLAPKVLAERRESVAAEETDSEEDDSGKKKRKRRRRATEAPRDLSQRKYACQSCPKTFARPSALTTHERSHTKDKPHICPMPSCGRGFSVPSNLRRHQRLHNHPNANDAPGRPEVPGGSASSPESSAHSRGDVDEGEKESTAASLRRIHGFSLIDGGGGGSHALYFSHTSTGSS